MQGYLTLATGPNKYLEMAINLALSLKLNDPGRPFCLVLDRETTLPEMYRRFVDHVVYMDERPGYNGCLNKLRVDQISPYRQTMFVDSDCILVKADMERHWANYSAKGFNIAGGKLTRGAWYGFKIEKVISELKIPYIVKMNSGVFSFGDDLESKEFFERARSLVSTHRDTLGQFHRNRIQLADEPFIGVAAGMMQLEPLKYRPEDGSIMVTTVNSSDANFDPITRTSFLIKKDNFRLLDRFFPSALVKHSPSFAHFVSLRPKRLYNKITRDLRTHFGLPSYEF